ncbi:MAG: NADH-quinone oxidoreductase subunit H, partial [Thaumarchaeota archaeon]|nr:NADH-quinone oxidoreductase subunit H [Nitrososphaerota archaeon]
MSVIAPKFRLGYFIKSLLDNIFWAVVLLTLVGIPAIQILLFYADLPIINGTLLTPFLAFTWMADPSRSIPLIKALMQTDFFRIAAFPGFGFAALLAAGTIFVERKMLAKLQLRVGPFYCGKVEGILQLMSDGIKL